MTNLQTTALGSLNKNAQTATANQISSYVNSIISAQSVALGGGVPDINSKAKANDNTTDSNSIVIGLNARNSDPAERNSDVIAIGKAVSADNWGTAVGVEAYANTGVAIGANAFVSGDNNPVALGRYAYAAAKGAVQLGGDYSSDYLAKNTEEYTLKFYAGSKGNVTVVDSNGKIPEANNSLSVSVLSSNASDTIQQSMRFQIVSDYPTTPEDGVIYIKVNSVN